MGKDFTSAAFREVHLEQLSWGPRRPGPAPEASLEGVLETRRRAESLARGHRAPSLAGPLPLWCQTALRCKGQCATKGSQSRACRVGGFLELSTQPPKEGREGQECQVCRRDGQEVGLRQNRMCLWKDWTDQPRGGGRKRQSEQGLGGHSDRAPQKPLQWILGTPLHQQSPALHADLPRTSGLDVQGQAGLGHIPGPPWASPTPRPGDFQARGQLTP